MVQYRTKYTVKKPGGISLSDIIVGLDIGTSTVRAVIGELDENNCLQISGVGKSISTDPSGIIVILKPL